MDGPSASVVAGFRGSRSQYLGAVGSWSPAPDGTPPMSVDAAVEEAAAALLPSARDGATTSLLVLNDAAVTAIADLRNHSFARNVSTQSFDSRGIKDTVQNLLPQVCPGLQIDPSMPCGPGRWGHAVESDS